MAVTYTANGGGDGNWSTAACWTQSGGTGGAYPGASEAGDIVVIGSHTITLDVSPAYAIASISFTTGCLQVGGNRYDDILVGTITGGSNASGSIQVTNTGNLVLGSSGSPVTTMTVGSGPCIVTSSSGGGRR